MLWAPSLPEMILYGSVSTQRPSLRSKQTWFLPRPVTSLLETWQAIHYTPSALPPYQRTRPNSFHLVGPLWRLWKAMQCGIKDFISIYHLIPMTTSESPSCHYPHFTEEEMRLTREACVTWQTCLKLERSQVEAVLWPLCSPAGYTGPCSHTDGEWRHMLWFLRCPSARPHQPHTIIPIFAWSLCLQLQEVQKARKPASSLCPWYFISRGN